MSAHNPCVCGERLKPLAERKWVVTQYRCNHSAFNGYHRTPSAYSAIRCEGTTESGHRCTGFWRTKAAYVERLRKA